jgi:pimeloyl-ACP methyl ester carboxylesterase
MVYGARRWGRVFMTAFHDRFVTTGDGLKLYVRDYPGPASARLTVLCIPGLTRNSRDFEDFAPHLAQKYRVLCVELRGRGRSEYAEDFHTYQPATYVRDILALLDQLGLKQIAFVGTSLGGIISMIISAVAATRVLGIVINDIGISVDPDGIARIAGYVARGYSGPSWDAAAEALRQLDGKIFPNWQHADWIRMAKRRFVAAPDGTIRHDYDLAIAKAFGDANQARSSAGSLKPFFMQLGRIPLLALRGGISDVLSQATFDEMKSLQPHMIQCLVPNRGHTPYLDEAEAVTAIDAFLEKLPDRLGTAEKLRRAARQTAFMIGYKLGMIR